MRRKYVIKHKKTDILLKKGEKTPNNPNKKRTFVTKIGLCK